MNDYRQINVVQWCYSASIRKTNFRDYFITVIATIVKTFIFRILKGTYTI